MPTPETCCDERFLIEADRELAPSCNRGVGHHELNLTEILYLEYDGHSSHLENAAYALVHFIVTT